MENNENNSQKIFDAYVSSMVDVLFNDLENTPEYDKHIGRYQELLDEITKILSEDKADLIKELDACVINGMIATMEFFFAQAFIEGISVVAYIQKKKGRAPQQ